MRLLRSAFAVVALCASTAAFAQGGVTTGNAVPTPTGAASGLPAPYLTAPPAVCSAGYQPASRDVAANDVGCAQVALSAFSGYAAVAKYGTNTVTFSSTPTYSATASLNYIVLTGSTTGGTLPGGTDGQPMTILVCQDGVGLRAFTLPSNVRGVITNFTLTATKCTSITMVYSSALTSWIVTGSSANL